MSNGKKIVDGLEGAIRHAKGDESATRVTRYAVTGTDVAQAAPEQFMQLARAARRTYTEFDKKIGMAMTATRAEQIKQWRCVEGYTWRAVASAAFGAWRDDAEWHPPSNQLAGMALCAHAARFMGEDADNGPWN